MTNRSANATIKGYFYQFDHAILQLLNLTDKSQVVTIEGVEDVDIQSDNIQELIQCKYYEQTEYNHSVIKPAVIEMLKHFKANIASNKFHYKLYGHYKSGQEKLVLPLTLEVLKDNFLKYEEKEQLHEVWKELSLTDSQLTEFIELLEIDNQAKSYDDQTKQILKNLKLKIKNSTDEDVEYFYYPAALNQIRKLAIQKNIEARKINVETFLTNINTKNLLFENWHISYLGEDKYKKYLNQKYFKFLGSTSVPKAARFFAIEYDNTINLNEYKECAKKISEKFSNKEHRTTPESDRFCPYLYLFNIDEANLIELKKMLKSANISFIDGFGFLGADFDVDRVCAPPNKHNKIKLKILNNISEFNQAINFNNHSQSIYTYEFYLTNEIPDISASNSISRNKIKVSNISSIKEIIK